MMTRFFALLPLLSLALAAPTPNGGDSSLDEQANANLQDDEALVSLKEICYRDLYADVSAFKVETEKEVLIQDDFGKDVFLFDGFRKDENDVEFYYREFCYKSVDIQAHNEDVQATHTAISDKRSLDGSGLDSGDLGEFGDDDLHGSGSSLLDGSGSSLLDGDDFGSSLGSSSFGDDGLSGSSLGVGSGLDLDKRKYESKSGKGNGGYKKKCPGDYGYDSKKDYSKDDSYKKCDQKDGKKGGEYGSYHRA